MALLLCTATASAHHAASIYDTTAEMTIRGTVVAFDWVQPHTWTRVRARDASGEPVVWSLEGMSPAYLGRRNWNRYSLTPGDEIEVSFYPRRDGSPSGMFLRAELADGTVKVMAIGPPQTEQ